MQCENPKCYQYHKDVGSVTYKNVHGNILCAHCGDRVDNSVDLAKLNEVPGYVKEHSDSIDARINLLVDLQDIPENILPGPMVWVQKSPGDETPTVSKIEHTDNIDHYEMDWMTMRDKVDTLFLSLRDICTDMNFQHVHAKLMELNREMVNLVYQERGMSD